MKWDWKHFNPTCSVTAVLTYTLYLYLVKYVFKYSVLGTEDHINRYRTYCKKCITNITWGVISQVSHDISLNHNQWGLELELTQIVSVQTNQINWYNCQRKFFCELCLHALFYSLIYPLNVRLQHSVGENNFHIFT